MNSDNYSVRLCLFIRQLASEFIPFNRLLDVANGIKNRADYDQTTKNDLTEAERDLSSFLGFNDKEMERVLECANADLAEENKKLRAELERVRGVLRAERELVEAYRRYSACLSTHNKQMAEKLDIAPSEYKFFRIKEEPTTAGTIGQ